MTQYNPATGENETHEVRQGRLARITGKCVDDNPYPSFQRAQKTKHLNWIAGWLEKDAELRRAVYGH